MGENNIKGVLRVAGPLQELDIMKEFLLDLSINFLQVSQSWDDFSISTWPAHEYGTPHRQTLLPLIW